MLTAAVPSPDAPAAVPSALRPLPRRPFLVAAVAITAATLATRVPLASHYLFAWDSANFAFGLDQYNVAAHQPHPPGYPLYVAAAWVLRLALKDANASFVALSVVASTAAAILVAGLAWRLLGGRAAAAATVLFLTSPNTWGHGLVAYPYAFLGLLSAATAWMAVETRWGGHNLAVPSALVLGLGSGFRPDALPLLAGVWLFGAAARGWRTVGLGAALAALGVLGWLVPAIQKTGGWAPYAQASVLYGEYWAVPTDSLGDFARGVHQNVVTLLAYLYQTSGPIVALLLVYGVGRVLAPPVLRARPQLLLLPVWILPPLAFYAIIHTGNLGYLLTFSPALMLLATVAAEALAQDVSVFCRAAGSDAHAEARRRPGPRAGGVAARPLGAIPAGALFAGLVAVAAVVNSAIFLRVPGPISLREVRDVDAELAGDLALLRSFPRESTMVVSFDRYRQLEYYLPSWRREGRLVSGLNLVNGAGGKRVTVSPLPGVDTVLLPDLYDDSSDRSGLERIPIGGGVDVFVARLRPGETLRVGFGYARVVAPPSSGR